MFERILPSIDPTLFISDRSGRPASAEHRLMVAVLKDAVQTYQKYLRQGAQPTIWLEARDWFLGRLDNDGVFSFKSVCEELGIEPSYFLRRLLVSEDDGKRKGAYRVPY